MNRCLVSACLGGKGVEGVARVSVESLIAAFQEALEMRDADRIYIVIVNIADILKCLSRGEAASSISEATIQVVLDGVVGGIDIANQLKEEVVALFAAAGEDRDDDEFEEGYNDANIVQSGEGGFVRLLLTH